MDAGEAEWLAARSRIYRGISRAQLHCTVVNEVVRGGLLEWMMGLEHEEGEFNLEAELKRHDAMASKTAMKKAATAVAQKAAPGTVAAKAAQAVPAAGGDAAQGGGGGEAVRGILSEQSTAVLGFESWQRIDELERQRGAAAGKVREKVIAIEEMLAAAQA